MGGEHSEEIQTGDAATSHYYLIDTNVLLAFLLNEPEAEESQRIFELAEQGHISAGILSWALHSVAHILYTREKDAGRLADFLLRVHNAQRIEVVQTSPYLEYLAVINTAANPNPETPDELPKTSLDFDDALHYVVAKVFSYTLVSFDSDFDKTDIKRYEPKDILGLETVA